MRAWLRRRHLARRHPDWRFRGMREKPDTVRSFHRMSHDYDWWGRDHRHLFWRGE